MTATQTSALQPVSDGDNGAIPDPVISLRGVTKRFGNHTVLKDLTFDIPRGKISAVLGPSGTGKSVLLKNIIGLLRPEEGQIYVDGEPIVGIRHKDMLRIRRKFGVLFQDGALFGSMDIYDNIAFPLREHTDKSEREIRTLVMEKAEMVGMVAHLAKLPGEISGGMRKRAGLARALILNPEVVFFDEPDSGLDPVRVAYLDELVKSVQEEIGCTFFIITHNIESVRRTAQYIGMLYRSSLVRFGPANEMFTSQRSLVKQFLAGSNIGPIGMDEMVDAARGEADVEALLHESQQDAPPEWQPEPEPEPEPTRSAITIVDQQFYDQEALAEEDYGDEESYEEPEPEPAPRPAPARKTVANRAPRTAKTSAVKRAAPTKATGTVRKRAATRGKDDDGLSAKERQQLEAEDERYNRED